MKKHSLSATKRTLFGRKVKNLRAQGDLPATVYGKKMKSESIQVPLATFELVHKAVGETGLVELTVGGETVPVLVHHVQKNPVNGRLVHVEFHKVDLREKVKAMIPLALVGDSPAVAQKTGALLSLVNEVEVEALPTDLPEKIEVDVTSLSEIDAEITVANLPVPSSVTLLTEGDVVVVKVGALVSKEAEEQAAEEAGAAAAASEEQTETASKEDASKEESSEPVKEEKASNA